MKFQDEVSDQPPVSLSRNLTGVFIMTMEWIFFVSAPTAGVLLVFLVMFIFAALSSFIGGTQAVILVLFASLYLIPLGGFLGFYIFRKTNQKISLGREQRNIALGIKSGVGVFTLAFLLCIAVAFKAQDFKLYVILLGVCVLSLILSVFVGKSIYHYLDRLST